MTCASCVGPGLDERLKTVPGVQRPRSSCHERSLTSLFSGLADPQAGFGPRHDERRYTVSRRGPPSWHRGHDLRVLCGPGRKATRKNLGRTLKPLSTWQPSARRVRPTWRGSYPRPTYEGSSPKQAGTRPAVCPPKNGSPVLAIRTGERREERGHGGTATLFHHFAAILHLARSSFLEMGSHPLFRPCIWVGWGSWAAGSSVCCSSRLATLVLFVPGLCASSHGGTGVAARCTPT